MNRKKGFTLVELLAVIVVLAVILAISIPAVTGIVNSARRKAFSESARLIVSAAVNKGGNDGSLDLSSIDVTNLKSVLGVKNTNYNFVSLNKNTDSIYLAVSGRGEWSNLKACGTYHDMVVTDLSDTSVCPEVVMDTDPGVICDYENESVCHIRSVEDLVAFSKMVNDTNHNYDFTDHTVVLDTNLDIENPASYVSPTTIAFGDINGDELISGLMKELTTEKGFQPIGSKDKKFKGIFEGKTKTIANLYIDRPATIYTGMFGYNSGIIRGLNAIGFDVTGGVYTAGIAAYNTGMISSIVFSGRYESPQKENWAYISGYNIGTVTNILIKNATFTEYYSNSVISGNGTSSGGALMESNCNNGHCYYRYYGNTISTLNDISNQINAYGYVLDTWVGGDNDSDGYYFDYNSNDQIVLKSVADDPMTFDLAGQGTESDPYLISDYNDWKQATLKVRNGYYFKLTNNINFDGKKYYAMGDYSNYFSGNFNGDSNELSNINFMTLQHGGMFGTNNGVIEGLVVDNLTLVGGTCTGGITESNTGTIKGITIKNLDLKGTDYSSSNVGGIAGVNSGIINTVDISGAVESNYETVGGLAGYNSGTIYNSMVNATVKGTRNVGIMLGAISDEASLSGVISGGTVTGNYNAGTAIGRSNKNYDDPSYNSIYISNSAYTVMTHCDPPYSGQPRCIVASHKYDDRIIGDVNGLDGPLDTWIGGDNDSNGYYFDNNDNNIMVIKSTTKYPMAFGLNGSGTNADPYLINNAGDWKQATLRPISGYIYKLNADIDFSGKYFYALGIGGQWFNGAFEGEGHTISNLSVKGINTSGIIGHVTSTSIVENLNMANINSIGGSYVGGLTGVNDGIVKGINATGVTVEGAYYTGGLVGLNSGGQISSIKIESNVKGIVDTGGLVGANANRMVQYTSTVDKVASVYSVLVNAIVVSNLENVSVSYNQARTGGIAGYTGAGSTNSDYSQLSGIMEDGSVTNTAGNSWIDAAIGMDANGLTRLKTFVSSAVQANSNSGLSSKYSMIYNKDYSGDINALDAGLDTWIGGDNDSDGYYFDYNESGSIVLKKVSANPMTFNLSGAGTMNNPYLIGSYDEWKQATLKSTGGYVFKLTANINFSGKKYYAFGSYSNHFNGTFLGDGYTVSNVTVISMTHGGMFGYNVGTIKGLNITGLNAMTVTYEGSQGWPEVYDGNVVTGSGAVGNSAGGIAGHNAGTITDIALQGTITGYIGKIGGVSGYNGATGNINNILADVTINSSQEERNGGLVGYNNGTVINNVAEGQIINHPSDVWYACHNGKIIGDPYSGTISNGYGLANMTVVHANDGYSGTTIESIYLNSLGTYDQGIDTRYGGDNDGDGYYFDYNSDSSNIIVKSAVRNPITTTPVTYPETESEAGTDTNESSCSVTSSCTAQGTTSMRCGYTYLYNSAPISGYESGYTYSMTKGGSCATATADNTDGGLLIYVTKKSTATGTCSVVLKISATGGTYNCASTKYSSFTFE